MNPAQADIVVPGGPAQPLGRSAFAVTAASALFVLSGYVINVVLGRALGPVDYGLFGVVIGLMTLMNSLQISAVPQAVARFTAERASQAGDLLFTGGVLQVGTGVGLSLALLVFAEPLAGLFGDGRLSGPFRIAALALPPYALFTLLLGFNGGRGRYSRQALMLSLYSASKAALAVGLGLLFALPGAIAGYLAAPLLGILTAGTWSVDRGRLLPLRPILLYSLPLLLLALFSVGHLNVDLFFVKSLVGNPASAGYYTAAQNIARVPYFLTTGFAIILLPAVARAASGTPRNAQTLVREAMRFGFLAVAPVAALLVSSADDLVPLLYSDAYSPATTTLMLLSPAMAFFALSALLASLLAGAGRPSHAVAAAGAGLLGSTLVCVLLVPALGMLGAAIATLSGATLALSIATVAAVRLFSFRMPWLSFVRAGIASTVIGIAGYMLNGTVATLIGLPVLALAYAALLIALREVRPEDWQRMRSTGLPGRL